MTLFSSSESSLLLPLLSLLLLSLADLLDTAEHKIITKSYSCKTFLYCFYSAIVFIYGSKSSTYWGVLDTGMVCYRGTTRINHIQDIIVF